MKLKIKLLLFLLVTMLHVNAQNYQWKTYNTANSGITNNVIHSIKEDKYGTKWIGTNNGLSKFDGNKWENWEHIDTLNPTGDSSRIVNSIGIDSKNNKWLATYNGLLKFDNTNKWSLHNKKSLYTLGIDSKDNIVITSENSIDVYNGINWKKIIEKDTNFFLSSMYNIYVDKYDTKWITVYGQNNGVGILKVTDSIEAKIKLPSFNTQIQAVKTDKYNNLWVGTGTEGVWKFDGTTWTQFTTTNSGLVSDQINVIEIENDSVYWFGTSSGLSRFNGTSWKNFTTSNSLLSGNYIFSIHISKTNEKWIGTWDYGITVLSENKCDSISPVAIEANSTQICEGSKLILKPSKSTGGDLYHWNENSLNYFVDTPELQDSTFTPGDYTFTFLTSDKNGCMLPKSSIKIKVLPLPKVSINLTDSTIYKTGPIINLQGAPFGGTFSGVGIIDNRIYPTKLSELGFQNIKYSWKDSLGCVGTTSKIILIADSTKNKLTADILHFTSTNSGLNDNTINCITIDKKSTAWVGTNKGLNRFDGVNWVSYSTQNSKIIGDTITSIAIDTSGFLWLVTTRGISKFDLDNTWKSFTFNTTINCLVIDMYDNKWIGSYNGLYKIDENIKDTILYRNDNSYLASNYIYSLTAKENDLWIGTDVGLQNHNIPANYFTFTYNSSNSNIIDNKINAIHIDNKYNIVMGTDKGLSKINARYTFNNMIYSYFFIENYSTLNSGLCNDTILSINSIDTNILLVATKNGLTFLKENKWETFLSQKRSVYPNEILANYVDANGNIWIGCRDGLYKISETKKASIEYVSSNPIILYPNPTKNKVTIANITPNSQVKIFDLNGKLMYTNSSNNEKIAIQLDEFAQSGMYILHIVEGDNIIYSTKIILE